MIYAMIYAVGKFIILLLWTGESFESLQTYNKKTHSFSYVFFVAKDYLNGAEMR